MTNLPAPYAFDMPRDEFEASVEAILKDGYTVLSPRRRDALGSYIFQAEAQRHFKWRVSRVPREKLGGIRKAALTSSVARALADAAQLTALDEMEVHESLNKLAEAAEMWGNTLIDRLPMLEALGLIEILERGSGNGKPYHVRLCITAEHREQITWRAAKSLRYHLELQNRRLTLLEPSDR